MPVSRNRKNQKKKAKLRNEKVRGIIKKKQEEFMKLLNETVMKQFANNSNTENQVNNQ